MQSTAAQLDVDAVIHEVGMVVSDRGSLTVSTSHGRYTAKVAFSCLVAPAAGDRVLLATTMGGEAFVLAVLERTGDEPAVLTTDRDLALRAPKGRVRIASGEGVDVTTTGELNLVSRVLGVRAAEGTLSVDALAYVGKLADIGIDRAKGLFGIVDQVAERVSQTVKRSYRFVEELDVTRAEQIDMRASANVNVRGKNAIVSAEQLVKMDAEQIHLG